MNGKQITAIVVAVLVVLVAYNSYFEVTPRQRVVLVQMGDIVGANYEPGLHFKIPFIQRVHVFDKRILTFSGEINRVLTSENKNLSVTYYVKWHISNTVKYYLSTHGSEDRAQHLLTDLAENDLLSAFSKRTVQEAVGGQQRQIVAAVQVQMNRNAQKLGMHVDDVRVMKLNLPKKVSASVYQRMRSKRQEVIQALRAEGDAAAKEIKSDARRARTEILAKAYRRAETLKGKGDAKATGIYAAAYKRDPDFYAFYRSLQMYRNSIGSGDLLLLAPKGELFKYFNPDTGNGQSAGNKPADSN